MHLPPLGDVLNPFLANRQLWDETKKIFWKTNRFHCLTVKDLHHFLKKLSDSYRVYLKHLSFAYVPNGRKIAHKMFPQVASLTASSKLRIRIDKKIWTSFYCANDNLLKTVDEYPGLTILAGLAIYRKVELESDCAELLRSFRQKSVELQKKAQTLGSRSLSSTQLRLEGGGHWSQEQQVEGGWGSLQAVDSGLGVTANGTVA